MNDAKTVGFTLSPRHYRALERKAGALGYLHGHRANVSALLRAIAEGDIDLNPKPTSPTQSSVLGAK